MAGDGSTTSSLTSTSHTLTYTPAMAPTSDSAPGKPHGRLALLSLMDLANRYQFLKPSTATAAESLQVAKETLDAFAVQVSDGQQLRLQESNRKRKRKLDRGDVLKIRKLHVDGFETGQVWQQAKKIISSALVESAATLRDLEADNVVEAVTNGQVAGDARTLTFGQDGFEIDSDDDDADSSASRSSSSGEEDGSDDDDDMSAVSGEGESDDLDKNLDGLDLEAEDAGGKDEDEDEDEDGEDLGREDGECEGDSNEPSNEFVEDAHGLNDGFFSIDDFNKQTQWFEDQDTRADPNTDAASDDDDIDWHTDPMAVADSSSKKSSSRKLEDEEEDEPADYGEDDDDDDENGPTFGNMDLDAADGASEDGFGDGLEGGLDLTANDIFYKDFFAPPAKKGKKGGKASREYRPKQPKEYDVEAAMTDVKRDLFDDLSEGSGSEDALSDVDAGDPKSRRSAHERRQAKILDEIRKLEAVMVKPKDWMLSGEAAAPARPLNSLLEEDLEFEHVGKPVPVITQEVSESIEEMIKRRIIAQEFDEVIRRLPGSDLPAHTRRGLVELDDSKAQQSLAELYEEEYVKEANPDTYMSKSDEKLRKEEKEVEAMWKEIGAKLDALSSWHYKPKPAVPSLTVVADVATVAMEDAQPATAQGVRGSASTLAPQEVYKAGRHTAEKGEMVVAKSGLPLARQEMSREEKLRRRRREKERIRKGAGAGAGAGDGAGAGGRGGRNKNSLSRKAQERKDTLSDLRKGGVMVINRQGEIMDVDGNKPKAARAVTSGSFKL